MYKVLETDRLVLRWLEEADAPFILELLNEPSFLQFIGDRGVRSLEDALGYIHDGPRASYKEHGFGLNLVEHKEEKRPIGMCGLLRREGLKDPDIGFAFLSRYWGRGYAFEAAGAALAHGRASFGLGRIVAITAPDNEASVRLLEKLGLSFETMVRLADDEPAVKLFS